MDKKDLEKKEDLEEKEADLLASPNGQRKHEIYQALDVLQKLQIANILSGSLEKLNENDAISKKMLALMGELKTIDSNIDMSKLINLCDAFNSFSMDFLQTKIQEHRGVWKVTSRYDLKDSKKRYDITITEFISTRK